MDATRLHSHPNHLASFLIAAALSAAVLPAVHAHADGACCMEDGTCQQTTHLSCYFAGGMFAGEGSDCLTLDCSGACCLPDGTCTVMSEVACDDAGGSYRGNGIACESVVCDLVGACCLGDAGCIPNTTLQYCTNALEGTWMGYGSSCSGADAVSCRGACCFDDGDCIEMETLDNCIASGGQFSDFGSQCSLDSRCMLDDPGAANVQVQRAAFNFVMLNNVDRSFTFDKFDDMGGQRQLRAVTVEINGHLMLVAVLRNAGDVPIDLREAIHVSEDLKVRFSENVTGLPVELTSIWAPALPFQDLRLQSSSAWLMPGQATAFESPYLFAADQAGNGSDKFTVLPDSARLDLSPFVAEPGDETFVVSMRGNSGLNMVMQGQGVLTHSPHRALGTIRVRYEYGLNLGACCLSDGSCVSDMTEVACEDHPLYQGWTNGIACADDARLCDVTGMCCLSDESCIDDIAQDECLSMPLAISWVAGASCSVASDRCDTRGACFLCTGQCFSDLTAAQCDARSIGVALPQFFPEMTCSEVESEGLYSQLGACCVPDGSCLEAVSEEECEGIENAIWNPCLECHDAQCEPIGACTFPFATCFVLPESECLVLGGTFFANTSCQFVPGSCEGDADDSGFVDITDLLIVISNWGGSGEGDITGDNVVDIRDLLEVISNFGDDCTFSG